MNIRNMTDSQLEEILSNPDHPRYDEACDEENYRGSIMSDPMVAQAMGEEFWEYN